MNIFKKKETPPCCQITKEDIVYKGENKQSGARIKILGSGCKKCNDLEKNVKIALEEMGVKEEIEHVTNLGEIASYGVMTTPALVFEKKVLSVGAVLSTKDIQEKLRKYLEV